MSNLRLFDQDFADPFEGAFRRFFAPLATDIGQPPLKMRVDVSEKPEAYEVKADIPGVRKDDIHVRIDGNVVRIDAEVRSEKETQGNGDKVLRRERYSGSISRSFSLAQDVDDARANAAYADGVLTLTLPKKQTPSSRTLSID